MAKDEEAEVALIQRFLRIALAAVSLQKLAQISN